MLSVCISEGFGQWRGIARQLYLAGIEPSAITWLDEPGSDLFASTSNLPEPITGRSVKVPAKLLNMLESAAQYRCAQRWALLYQILWRAADGDRAVSLAGDPLGSALQQRLKSVRREAHHLHAFLRFVPVTDSPWEWVAWFEPAHDVLLSASEHFVGRLGKSRWMIATPSDAVSFDGQQLGYISPCPMPWQVLAKAHLDADQSLWQTYYQSTFNPARLNPSMLTQQMPTRFWKNLPEGFLIQQLMSEARAGTQRDGQAKAVAQKIGKQIVRTPLKP